MAGSPRIRHADPEGARALPTAVIPPRLERGNVRIAVTSSRGRSKHHVAGPDEAGVTEAGEPALKILGVEMIAPYSRQNSPDLRRAHQRGAVMRRHQAMAYSRLNGRRPTASRAWRRTSTERAVLACARAEQGELACLPPEAGLLAQPSAASRSGDRVTASARSASEPRDGPGSPCPCRKRRPESSTITTFAGCLWGKSFG
jgi:hypothetical protein